MKNVFECGRFYEAEDLDEVNKIVNHPFGSLLPSAQVQPLNSQNMFI